jgi:quercetin dioxygenase-like cupin family protein
MTVADITLAVFTLFNSARFLAYVPQIIKATKDQSGAEAISFGTWALFLASHLSAMAYAIVNQADWTMASLFLSNAVGCGAIILIAGFKRSRHRRRAAAAATDDDHCAEPFRMLAGAEAFNPLTLGNPDRTVRRDLRMTRECTLVEEDRTRSDLAELGLKLGLIVMVLVLGGVALAQTATPAVVALTPAEMKWQSQGGLAAPGMEQINLVGDPAKPGPYTLRLKFPKGFRIEAHSHPDSREVTILSGTFATGYGEKFDPAGLKILPAGSFYTEPANVPHYIEIKEEVVLQVSGMGPSGRKFVDRPVGSK